MLGEKGNKWWGSLMFLELWNQQRLYIWVPEVEFENKYVSKGEDKNVDVWE